MIAGSRTHRRHARTSARRQIIRGVSLAGRDGRAARDHRPQRRRQVHPVPSRQRPLDRRPRARSVCKGERIDGLRRQLEINRRGLSRSFQVTNIFPRLSVYENLRCATLWSLGYRYSFWRRSTACGDVSGTRGMADGADRPRRRAATCPAGVLSYAEQRALEIGITIAGDADVILLDEPTAGMSRTETEQAVALIRRVSEGKTLVMVEHDMGVVFDLADRISVLVYGQIDRQRHARAHPRERSGAGGLSRTRERVMERALLEVADLHAYYGKSHILQRRQFPRPCERDRQPSRPQRRRPLDDDQGDHGRRPRRKARSASRARRSPASSRTRSRAAASATSPRTRDIFPGLTVRQNLLLGEKPGKSGVAGRCEDMFRLFPRSRSAPIRPPACSPGGEQQMLTICRTLMGDPDLIMIDEPTEGLSPMMVEHVGALLEEIARRGVSILLVEQKLTIALKISARLYVMGHGKVVFEGSPAGLMADRRAQGMAGGVTGAPLHSVFGGRRIQVER